MALLFGTPGLMAQRLLSRPANGGRGIGLDGGYKGAPRELANPQIAVQAGIHSQRQSVYK
jgi:hypothetical protein